MAQKTINFLIKTNPQHPPGPLNQIASGGELSRISLALQLILAKHDCTPTLVFDEVDVGIGGATAEIVGKCLHQLSKDTQLLCITHLPQVAAQADHHLQVQKTVSKQKASSQLKPLNPAERIQEIARMLGGQKITEQTLAHAKEMLDHA